MQRSQDQYLYAQQVVAVENNLASSRKLHINALTY